jgi:hypothetical protein
MIEDFCLIKSMHVIIWYFKSLHVVHSSWSSGLVWLLLTYVVTCRVQPNGFS